MKNQGTVYGIIGLIIGIILTGVVMNMSRTSGMHTSSSLSMNDMMKGLDGRTGDDFDKAFMEEMMQHHEGAISMAKEAQKSAKHEEIKSMANDIIVAQTKEIDQMKQWQKQWGY